MRRALFLLVSALSACTMTLGQSFKWGGSVRGYQFLRLQELPEALQVSRVDSEYVSGRFILETEFLPRVTFETHAVLDLLSPSETFSSSVATGRTSTFLPLEHEFSDGVDYNLVGSLDRLNVELDFTSFKLKLGRQAIGWGVNYFWPAMDLFSSFAAQRIDRDYKAGVDAIRLTVPLGSFSEVEVVGGVLGPSTREDGTLAAKARLHLGRVDLGLMGGRFHRDTVAGVFLTSDFQGTLYRGEFTWTDSGDPRDEDIGRPDFWRAAVGLDRQLTPNVGAVLEFSYNGYGFSDASDYALLLQSDRFRRGELTAFGKYHLGTSIVWQMHPLWTMNQTLLLNAGDPSGYWIPSVDWSTSNNSSLLLAAQIGFGNGFTKELDLQSEYGIVPATLFVAFKWYF